MTPGVSRRCRRTTCAYNRLVGDWVLYVWILWLLVAGASGHGRLWEPPSRSSMWRLGYNTSINTDDNELSCGGFTNQWIHFSGRCGICGDPYQQRPRDNEHDGKYASGLITRTYPIGGIMDVVVDLTANHLGFFEFRLCPINYITGAEPEVCPDGNRLPIINGEDAGYRFYIRDPTVDGHVTLQVQLPKNIYCKHCLLQWKYHTGTRWGCDRDLRCDKGIGPQEEFYGCSDISIDNVSSTIYRNPTDFADSNSINPIAQPREFATPSIKIDNLKKLNIGKETKGTLVESLLADKKSSGPVDILSVGYLHQIVMDALVKHYDSDVGFGGFKCKAAPTFAANPIVNEWCRQTCPRNKHLCKPSMCTCKTKVHELPALGLRKPLVLIKGRGDQSQVFKKLGMDKDEFASFIRRAIHTYRSNEVKKPEPLNDSPAETKKHKRKESNRRKIVFIKVNDKKTNLTQLPYKFEPRKIKSLSRKTNVLTRNSARSLPLKSSSLNRNISLSSKSNTLVKAQPVPKLDISTYEDNRDGSNDIYGRQASSVSHNSEPRTIRCIASAEFKRNKYMNKWCVRNCSFGFCPKSVCTCV